MGLLPLAFPSRFTLVLGLESPSRLTFHIGLQRAGPGQKAGGRLYGHGLGLTSGCHVVASAAAGHGRWVAGV